MTHEEPPWADAAKRSDKVITIEALLDHFSQQVDDDYVKKAYG